MVPVNTHGSYQTKSHIHASTDLKEPWVWKGVEYDTHQKQCTNYPVAAISDYMTLCRVTKKVKKEAKIKIDKAYVHHQHAAFRIKRTNNCFPFLLCYGLPLCFNHHFFFFLLFIYCFPDLFKINMQFHAQQNDYNQFAAAAAAAAYTPNIYYEQQQAMMPPHDALLYDLHDTYAQHLPSSDQMIIPPPSSTTTTTTMIPRAGASASNTSSSNNRKRPKRKQVKNACGKFYQLFTPHTTPFLFSSISIFLSLAPTFCICTLGSWPFMDKQLRSFSLYNHHSQLSKGVQKV